MNLPINLNPSVLPADKLRLKKQAEDIFALFCKQDLVSTGQMASLACQYQARLSEIRRALEPFGKEIILFKRSSSGNNWYKMQEMEKT